MPEPDAFFPNRLGNAPTGKYSYPEDYASTLDNWLLIQEYEYSRPTRNTEHQPKSTGNEIKLPLPQGGMNPSYSANWETTEFSAWMNALMQNRDLLGAAFQDIQDINLFSKEEVQAAIDKYGGVVKDFARAIMTDSITSVPGRSGFDVSLGTTRNPFLAAMFTSVNLRSFTFAYIFIPRNKRESDTVEGIINILRYGMHPSYDSGIKNNLFRYPYMYKVDFTDAQRLFRPGWCVIKDLQIDFQAENGLPLYHIIDGESVPYAISMNITFQELDVVTKESISEGTVY